MEVHGIYPKIFIASGEKTTLNNADNKVVQLPYKNFLNEDGTPKVANEIWNMINKAGVPRYAELVCISDKLEEAAVNYFIFKLMGFPDVKVWADN
jgi:3-mercaptopyruvate sulfurtransferase SseA